MRPGRADSGSGRCEFLGVSPAGEPACESADDNIAYFQGDGLEDSVTTIHGVSNVDPNTNQWTTPDVYEGDISDPMSQAKYMWDNNNPVAYQDPAGYCSNPSAARTDSGASVCADAYIPTANAGLLQGDNRETSGNQNPDTYRVRVNLNFKDHSGSIQVAHSHWSFRGGDAGQGHLLAGSKITWTGNSAHVQVTASCGPCNGLSNAAGFTIRMNLTFTMNSDGNVAVSGTRSAYPAFEAYLL